MNKFALLLLSAAIAGCAVGPDYQAPQITTSAAPAQFGAAADAAYSADAPPAQFWTVFGDAGLDALVTQALGANHDLRIAVARLNEARALRRETRLDLLPTVTLQAGHNETRLSEDQLPAGSSARRSSLDSASFDAYWELDLFGRVRRAIEASRASEQMLAADLGAARISVAAEVARAYFELRGAQEQLAVAQRNADNQRATADYVQARFDAGAGSEFDTARAQAQLNATLALLPPLEAAVANTIHRLSVLVGQPPQSLRAQLEQPAPLPELPRLTSIGTPETLLRRRPDIRAAERNLAAATARIGVATADLFPRVTFSGEIGFAADGGRLGATGTDMYSYGPGISWAAFDLGRVRARIGQAEARADGALAGYEQTVLRALEETESALVSYSRARRQLDHLRNGMQASARAAELAQTRFAAGSSDFLEVLDAERVRLAADAAFSQARTGTAASLVALYKALGGSWELSVETPAAASIAAPATALASTAAGH